MPATAADAGTAYAELISEQLTEERSRKSSLEQRGGLVITTSGTLVSLLFGLAAVVTSRKGFSVPFSARVLLLLAVVAFIAAALGGLAANLPLREYLEPEPESLRELTELDSWEAEVSIGARAIALARVDVLAAAREANDLKAVAVILAFAAEVVAIGLVAAAVGIVLA